MRVMPYGKISKEVYEKIHPHVAITAAGDGGPTNATIREIALVLKGKFGGSITAEHWIWNMWASVIERDSHGDHVTYINNLEQVPDHLLRFFTPVVRQNVVVDKNSAALHMGQEIIDILQRFKEHQNACLERVVTTIRSKMDTIRAISAGLAATENQVSLEAMNDLPNQEDVDHEIA
eukprot:TRINITY_DN5220_c0_g1_i2.p1 TRINITY_DN5220_c0_g1~~TRINITY_DN5220_c0_g1_i2.p1  ORF type:complete len:177 (+),score=39.73 TRINITY_DN5220_c0_g1_i2:495-1025(+)